MLTQTTSHISLYHEALCDQLYLPIVAVAVHPNRHIEIHVSISIVGLSLSQIPLNAAATKHRTAKAKIECILGTDNTNVLSSVNPCRVGVQQILNLMY